MIKDFFFRIIKTLPTLLGISFLSFVLIRLIPGDPVMLLLGERGADPQTYLEMQKSLGLDLPWYQQYFKFLAGIFNGDLGTSIISKQSVHSEFWARFPATLELGICSMLFAIIIGIPLGILAAAKRNSIIDYLLMGGSLIGYSMPIFWWGLILILIVSVQLGLTPVSGRISVMFDIEPWSGFYLIDTLTKEVVSEEGYAPFWSALRHIFLPAIVMGTIPLAVTARMTRSSMLEVLGEDYIRTAKAKGVSPLKVVAKHAFRNALIPIVTVIGLMFGGIITGAILTETIFSWPGIGKWIVQSVNQRDYPVIQGGVLYIGFLVILVNQAVDLLYSFLNPRLRK